MEESKTKRVGQVFAIAIALAFVIPTMITFVGMATEQSDLPILESNNAPDTRLFLRHGDFDTNRGEPYARANYQAGYGADEEVFYIVQFNDKVTDEMKDSVRGVGAKVLETEYIHENAYVVKMTGNMKGNIEKLSSVQWCGLLQPDYKISDKSDDWAGEYYWCVWVFKGEDVRDVAAELKTIGAREVMIEAESLTNPEKRNNPYIYCYIDMAIMPEVLTIPEIAFINDRSPVPLTRSKQSSELLNAADAWDTARSGLDVPLTGYDPVTGYQGLGITDSGLDASHLDFTTGPTGVTRVFNGGTDSDGHGTGCAGAAAGNGWNWLSVHGEVLPGAGSAVEYDRGNAGTAPEAMVNMYSTTPDPELSHDDQYFDGPIFRVFSSSSGYDPADGTYESQCAGIDAFIFDTGWDSIGCYAAANSGDAPQYPGDTPGPYGVLDPLKNGLCVAASNNDAPQNGTHTYTGYGIVEWSSRGPSDDGRIKPDIAAPGTFVHSTRSDDESDSIPYGPNEEYKWFGGTSCATPIVAGTAMLVRQYYNAIESIPSPSMSLMKATLINGADDTGHGIPSYSQGWGLVNVRNSLFPTAPRSWDYMEDISVFDDAADEYNFNIDVIDNRVPLRITLVWADDSPGAVGGGVTILNDLDLTVTAPDATEYHGNIFRDSWSYPDPVNGLGWEYDSDNDGYDDRNTVECVYIDVGDVQVGSYAVNVDIAYFDHVSAATGGIPFALVWSGDLGVIAQTGKANDIGMRTDSEYLHHIRSEGIVTFPFTIYNQGQAVNDDVSFTSIVSSNGLTESGWTITFEPASITDLPSGESLGCVATIEAPSVPRNDFNITLFADSSGGLDQESLSLMVNVIDTEVPMPEKAIFDPGNQLQPDPFYVGGKIYVAYNSGERYWDGDDSSNFAGMSSVHVKMSADGGDTWTPVGPDNGRASTPMPLPAGPDGGSDPGFFTEPNDISICARSDGDVMVAYTTSMRFWLMVSYYDAGTDTWTQNLLYTVLNTDTDVEFLDQAGISGCSVGTSDGAATDVWWVIGCILYDDLGSSPSANEELYYFTSTTGTSWTAGTQVPVAADAGQYDRQHMSTVDGDNTFWLVWRCAVSGGSDGYQRKVWYTKWDATDATPVFEPVRNDIGASADEDQDCNWPYVYAVPGTNEVWFAWYEAALGDPTDLYDVNRVRVRYTPDGGATWSNIFGPFGTNTLMWNNYDAEEWPVGIARTTDGTIWIGYMDLYWTDGSQDPYSEVVWDWALFPGLPGASSPNYRCAYTDNYDLTTFTPSYYQVTSDNYGKRQHRMVADGDTALVFGDRTTSYDIEDEISLTHPTNPQPDAWSLSNGLSSLDRDIYMYRMDNLGLADTEGPITYNIGATPNPVNQTVSSTFDLFATINDVYTGNSLVRAATPAEYSLDGGTWTAMNLVDAATTTQTEGVEAKLIDTLPDCPGTPEGVDYTIEVRGYDENNNLGPVSSMILTVIAYNIPPAVTVDYPTDADIVEIDGIVTIAWTANDFDGDNALLDIEIEYSDDSGLSWNPIVTLVDGNTAPFTYDWDVSAIPDDVNYLVLVTATDEGTPAIAGNDVSDTAFSIDNFQTIPGQKWHFQAFGAPEMELNMKPVENTPNNVGAQVSGAGDYFIGQWLSDPITGGSLAGAWEFSAWGMVDRAGCTGVLRADIYQYGNPTIQASAADDDNVGDDFVMTQYTWNPTIAGGFVSAGEQILIELYVEATVGLGTTTNYYYPDSDIPVGGTVTGTFANLDDTTPGVVQSIEEEVTVGGQDALPATKGPQDITADPITDLHIDDNLYYAISRNRHIEMESFDVTGVAADLTSCVLEVTYYIGFTYTGSNYIEWALDGQAYADTTIQPLASETSEITKTYDLFAQGVDTAAEVATLDIHYYNDDGNPGTTIFFDVLKVVCGWSEPSNLEHKWTIPVTTGVDTYLGVHAWRTDSPDGDTFTFSYSTDDVSYTDVYTVSAIVDPGVATETLIVPSVPTGTLYIKVVDDDRTVGNNDLDTIIIDQLYIKAEDPGPTFSFYYDHGDTPSYVAPVYGGSPQFGYDIDTSGYSVGEWAFVSFAFVMTGDIEFVLADFSGGGTTWDIAKWYNPLDANNPWKMYSINSPTLSDMPQINQNMGVWLHLTANDGTLTTSTVGDYSAVPVDVTLNPGWNLVGYPSTTGENAADSLLGLGVNWIGEYQAATPYINDESDLSQVDMSEGNAYWIHVDALITWTVNP